VGIKGSEQGLLMYAIISVILKWEFEITTIFFMQRGEGAHFDFKFWCIA
jgi:hypothetical protein